MKHTQDAVYPAIINQAQVSGNIEISPPGHQPIESNSGYTYEPGNGNNV
jgi:hypothetical protein